MTDRVSSYDAVPGAFAHPEALRRLKQRHAAERRFRLYGLTAIGVSILALLILLATISLQARSAFTRHVIAFDLTLDAAQIAPDGIEQPELIASNLSGFNQLVQQALRDRFPHYPDQLALRRELYGLVPRLGVLSMGMELCLLN